MKQRIDSETLKLLRSVKGKRSSAVIEHIIEHGYITTAELKDLYGYNHPPRAARDVREQGIPLETTSVVGPDGRRIAAYRFGDLASVARNKLGGRRTFSRSFKNKLWEEQGSRCAICNQSYEKRYLQIDHLVPYEVAGEGTDDRDTRDYMLLCGSCNRAKSWSCEHCTNWRDIKDPKICLTCYWARPLEYSHIATYPIRRLDLVWAGDEVQVYDRLQQLASEASEATRDFIKKILEFYVSKNS